MWRQAPLTQWWLGADLRRSSGHQPSLGMISITTNTPVVTHVVRVRKISIYNCSFQPRCQLMLSYMALYKLIMSVLDHLQPLPSFLMTFGDVGVPEWVFPAGQLLSPQCWRESDFPSWSPAGRTFSEDDIVEWLVGWLVPGYQLRPVRVYRLPELRSTNWWRHLTSAHYSSLGRGRSSPPLAAGGGGAGGRVLPSIETTHSLHTGQISSFTTNQFGKPRSCVQLLIIINQFYYKKVSSEICLNQDIYLVSYCLKAIITRNCQSFICDKRIPLDALYLFLS